MGHGPAFRRFATIAASTKRNPAIGADGRRGMPVTNIALMKITPLDPVDPDLQRRMEIDTAHELLQTYADGTPDIIEGDVLVVDDVEYPIRSVADWAWRHWTFRHLIIEDLRA